MNKEELITIFENILEEYSPNTEPLSLEGEYEIEYIQVKSLMNYINNLKQENNQLKKMLIHKHKYASEMEGKYILEKAKLDQLRSWLEEDLKQVYRDAGYRHNIIEEVLSKLNELESNKDEKV